MTERPPTEARFYHLTGKGVGQALPEMLLRAIGRGQRVVVRVADAAEAERLNQELWTFPPNHFLPHGSARDGDAAEHPVWITDRDENPNGAEILIIAGATPEADFITGAYALRCALFDGRDVQAVEAARTRWKLCRDAGFDVTYWQQGETGGWEKKA